MTMANTAPRNAAHAGRSGGRVMARRSPVQKALPSRIDARPFRTRFAAHSDPTAPAIEATITPSAGSPKTTTPQSAAGASAAFTVHMIFAVVSEEWTWGPGP